MQFFPDERQALTISRYAVGGLGYRFPVTVPNPGGAIGANQGKIGAGPGARRRLQSFTIRPGVNKLRLHLARSMTRVEVAHDWSMRRAMSKLFLSMMIGAVVILASNDESRGRLRDTLRTLALTVAEAVQR